jgi:hypothetical protein
LSNKTIHEYIYPSPYRLSIKMYEPGCICEAAARPSFSVNGDGCHESLGFKPIASEDGTGRRLAEHARDLATWLSNLDGQPGLVETIATTRGSSRQKSSDYCLPAHLDANRHDSLEVLGCANAGGAGLTPTSRSLRRLPCQGSIQKT